MTDQPSPKLAASEARTLAAGLALAWTLPGALLLGLGIGWLVDRWLHSRPWGMTVSSLVFLAAGVFSMLRQIKPR